jgi:sulfocyanin
MLRVRIAALAAALCVGVGVAARAAGATAPEAVAAADSVTVNQFMSYDASTKTVSIQLVASFGSVNGGMNFNGGYKGNQTITVPQGWTVKMHFVNKDAIPHSAIVLPDKFPLPMQPQDPALPRAYTIEVTAGLPTGGTDEMNFKASQPGKYLIVCGVPGHGPSGMYIGFVIAADAKAPSYAM